MLTNTAKYGQMLTCCHPRKEIAIELLNVAHVLACAHRAGKNINIIDSDGTA
jgi:hypothetical protein